MISKEENFSVVTNVTEGSAGKKATVSLHNHRLLSLDICARNEEANDLPKFD